MNQNVDELYEIAAKTLEHYDQREQGFWEGTRDHDVSQNIAALMQYIKAAPPFDVLDFGCGPGRDLMAFKRLGHRATGLEGAKQLVDMARTYSGCEVLHQNFLQLNLPSGYFDGVFANASLFHIPSQALPRVLNDLHQTLKPNGVLFSSNPRGHGQAGWSGDRYSVFHDLPAWRDYLREAGFVELAHYYCPAGLPREQQAWLASVWRKVER